MLYDPKWDKQAETKAYPFTLESLIAWLEKQPSEKTYEYFDCDGACLYGQYMHSVGVSWEDARFATRGPDDHGQFRDLVYRSAARNTPHTFGAALERARAALSSTDTTEP